jgi:signal transduction histidine kinase
MRRTLKRNCFQLKVHYFSVVSIFLFVFSSAFCQGQAVNDFSYKNIGEQLHYLEDKSGKLALSDIKALNDTAFSKGKQEILNFGNTSSAWWIKIRYAARPHLPVYLIIDAPNIEYIDAFVTDSSGNTVNFETGCLRIGKPNVLIRNNFLLNLPIAAKAEEKAIYLRLKTNNILLAPIKLATAESVMTGQEMKLGIEYIYIGLLIGLLLFNLFLFISIKDVTYLYYVLYVLTLSSYLLIYIRGYGFIFGDELRIILNKHPHVFLSLSVVTSLLFCNRFLHLKRTAPKMIKFFYVIGGFGVILFFVSITGFKHIAAVIAQLLTVTVAVVAWIAGVLAYRNGHKPAKYYILAWFFIWVTVAIVTLSLAGVVPSNEFTIQLVPIGSTIELLLLSFALGDRYKVIMRAEQQARDENLLLIKTQNQRLEESVNERTLQLNNTINKLEETDAVKNKLFSIIAHDLRSPLNSLLGILSLSDMQLLTPDELRTLLAENKKTVESINNTLNNLLHWAQSQMKGSVTEMQNFELKTSLDELLLLYLPLAKKKSICLEQHIEVNGMVYADRNQINLVLRNLIDNAIKFTPLSGKISFVIQSTNEGVRFVVENEIANEVQIDMDNIVGKKMAISTPGTQNEHGVGLGLLLCKEYVKNNGGTFHADLIGNKIKFSFVLPKEKN